MSKADKLLKRVEFYEKMASSRKPENDDLLKRASLFERLALYSDRKSFLSALAQQLPSSGSDVKGAVDALAQALAAWLNTSAEKREDLGGIRGFPASVAPYASNVTVLSKYPESAFNLDVLNQVKTNASQLAYVNKNLRDASDDVRRTWINTVLPAATNVITLADKQIAALNEWKQSIPTEESPDVGSGKVTIPEVNIQGRPGLPSINPADQEAVFNFAIQEAGLVPNPAAQKPDGQLGRETRKALEAVKNYFAKKFPQNARMTDQEAIRAAKLPPRQ